MVDSIDKCCDGERDHVHGRCILCGASVGMHSRGQGEIRYADDLQRCHYARRKLRPSVRSVQRTHEKRREKRAKLKGSHRYTGCLREQRRDSGYIACRMWRR